MEKLVLFTTTSATNGTVCGCAKCTFKWTQDESEIQSLVLGSQCSQLMNILSTANPVVALTDGELCSKFLEQLLATSIQHIDVGNYLAGDSSCPADLKVSTKEDLASDAAADLK